VFLDASCLRALRYRCSSSSCSLRSSGFILHHYFCNYWSWVLHRYTSCHMCKYYINGWGFIFKIFKSEIKSYFLIYYKFLELFVVPGEGQLR
jgi:hypothetical protein